ncbi:TPA: hypothetical protein OW273_001575 [Citrobacter freundii]|nr:hypothetical protein [Citrobacter freundii]HCW0686201.1 hypothetical protein [Citrobacter freundii]
MLLSQCPLCLSNAGIQVLRATDNSEIIVFSCKKHGMFSISHDLNVQLLNLHSVNARDAADKLALFTKKVLGHTHAEGESQSYVPLFRSFDD